MLYVVFQLSNDGLQFCRIGIIKIRISLSYMILSFYIVLHFVLLLNVLALPKEKPSRGAVVTLIKGNKETLFVELLKRNKSVYKYMWKNASTIAATGPNPDIVLFYEKIATKMKKYIQDATPRMPIKFVQIKFDGFGVFEKKRAKLVNPLCPPTETSSTFHPGYHDMCRFWFIGFLDYVKMYDWVFRLDADCQLLTDVTTIMPGQMLSSNDLGLHHRHTLIASPAWMNLLHEAADGVNRTSDGDVVRGMGPFVRDFEKRYSLSKRPIDSWYAPYTNAVFMNTRWLRAHQSLGAASSSAGGRLSQQDIVRQFMKEVDASNCIYSNRW